MRRKLLVLRHGKSDWDEQVSDFDRPLTRRGEKAAQRVAKLLDELDLMPDQLITSPAVRALSTSEVIEEELGDVDLTEDERLYGADLNSLLSVVHGLEDQKEIVLLVGHNPVLEEIVDFFAGTSGTVMKTCSLAILEGDAGWDSLTEGSMRLDEIYHQDKDDS